MVDARSCPAPPGGLRVVRTADEHGGVILSLDGELDLSTAPELERELARVLDELPVRVVVDLSRLTFMDSTGLALIIHAERDTRRAGIGLRLRGGSAQVRRLFELTGLVERLTFDG